MAGKFKKGARCSSACSTKEHRTFGECMRAKDLQLNPNLSNTGATKAWDGELQAYRDARSQGIQPSGTTMAKIREAEEISQRTGQAFKG
jgi:hypothetical protein